MEITSLGFALVALTFVFEAQSKIKKLEKRIQELENKSNNN
ncbi:hypothetical protein [Salibacterium salarium]|nr:hypothetical protein [Salibacterium salarium]